MSFHEEVKATVHQIVVVAPHHEVVPIEAVVLHPDVVPLHLTTTTRAGVVVGMIVEEADLAPQLVDHLVRQGEIVMTTIFEAELARRHEALIDEDRLLHADCLRPLKEELVVITRHREEELESLHHQTTTDNAPP